MTSIVRPEVDNEGGYCVVDEDLDEDSDDDAVMAAEDGENGE